MPIIPACGRLRQPGLHAEMSSPNKKQSTQTSESTPPSIRSGISPRTPECQKTIALNASNLYVLTNKANGLYLSAKHLHATAAASAIWGMPVKLVLLFPSKSCRQKTHFLSQTSASQHSIELLFLDWDLDFSLQGSTLCLFFLKFKLPASLLLHFVSLLSKIRISCVGSIGVPGAWRWDGCQVGDRWVLYPMRIHRTQGWLTH